jgi:ribosomal protein S18 acetylase RimI-like enzyme
MGRNNLSERFIGFYRRNGLIKTVVRIWLSLKRTVWEGEIVLFYSELKDIPDIENNYLNSLEIERIRREEDIPEPALRRLLQHWNEAIMRRHIRERFIKGAVLWLAKFGKDYCGFGWSINGSTIEPYFFPLNDCDAHLFDFYVFSEYRGSGFNPILVNHILLLLKQEGLERAFIETRAWNKEKMHSLRKTYFHKLGEVRKVVIFGKPIVFWSKIAGKESSNECDNFGILREPEDPG